MKLLVVGLLIAFTLCVIMNMYIRDEKFSTKREKAATIVEWFNKNAAHSYENFRTATGRMSNIVEYEDAMKLYKLGTLTPATLEMLL